MKSKAIAMWNLLSRFCLRIYREGGKMKKLEKDQTVYAVEGIEETWQIVEE